MSLTSKALFVIERNLDSDLTLESVASACGVSRFHIAHAFAASTGRTVIEYVRARRLSEAARKLSRGAPNILDVAMNAGYTSHEAFSRAFRARFDITPDELRKRAALEGLILEEIFSMNTMQRASLALPEFKTVGKQLFVGMAAPRHMGDSTKIPAQWRDFMSGAFHQIANK